MLGKSEGKPWSLHIREAEAEKCLNRLGVGRIKVSTFRLNPAFGFLGACKHCCKWLLRGTDWHRDKVIIIHLKRSPKSCIFYVNFQSEDWIMTFKPSLLCSDPWYPSSLSHPLILNRGSYVLLHRGDWECGDLGSASAIFNLSFLRVFL